MLKLKEQARKTASDRKTGIIASKGETRVSLKQSPGGVGLTIDNSIRHTTMKDGKKTPANSGKIIDHSTAAGITETEESIKKAQFLISDMSTS